MTLVIVGTGLIIFSLLARCRRLPPNPFVGIRLPSVMRSDEAWYSGHEVATVPVALAGFTLLITGVAVLIDPEAIRTVPIALLVTVGAIFWASVAARAAALRA